MNAKEMLDQATTLIARGDVNRATLLFYMNTTRKGVLRDKEITKLYKYLPSVPHTSGVIDLITTNFVTDYGDFDETTNIVDFGGFTSNTYLDVTKIKTIKALEWDNGGKIRGLKKVLYADARKTYPDFTVTGEPRYYVEIGTTIQILPVLTTGSINILAEVWPDDLNDSDTSTDITTQEIPEAWIYLAASEYFDFLDEVNKGKYFRDKANFLIDQYIAESNKQYNTGLDLAVEPYYRVLPSMDY